MVFQQRNGRIDRYGQEKRPDIRYMMISSRNERIKGDMRIIKILVEKEEQAFKNIGDPTLLFGKFNIEDEELVISETIENGSDAAAFEESLHDEEGEFDPLDFLLNEASMEETTSVNNDTVDDETLFTDKQYLIKALTYINKNEQHPLRQLSEISGIDVMLTDDMRQRLSAVIPEEAMPSGEILRLSDDKTYIMQEMRKSMQHSIDNAAWPDAQFLWAIHPIISWLNDKTGLLIGRGEAPVIGVKNFMHANESIFIVEGSMPNERSAALVDDMFCIRYVDGKFIEFLDINTVVNGNSLIGARRQVYHKSQLTATSKGLRWYENAPERIPFVKLDASGRNIARSRYQVYNFLTGDPGMCDYTDKVIKSLEPEKLKTMKNWKKKFTASYTEDEFKSLIELSKLVDALWKKQIKARHELEAATITALDVYGHKDERLDSGRSIREKDKFLRDTYKSEHAQNAGAYARLKFAMDYWCALWFWPISQADLLPSRSDFIFEMDLILRGTMPTDSKHVQIGLFETDIEDDVVLQEVDLDQLCELFPRLDLVRKIANENKFMHWELEFADVFADKGGFDLVIGNPPWIKLEWNEQNVLSDKNPMFAIKSLTATQVTSRRSDALTDRNSQLIYFDEYESITGQQSFLNALTNYSDLKGSVTNLFKCFLPQAWQFGSLIGVSAFVHPDGVYDDPKGGLLREKLYSKLRYHFQFENELNLFEGTNDHGRMRFALNVYSNLESTSFDTISNLFYPTTVDECYDDTIAGDIPGIKDKNGNWNVKGHPGRVVNIGKKELELFAKLFDGSDKWKQAKLPGIHAKILMDSLVNFGNQEILISSLGDNVFGSAMLPETSSQTDDTILRKEHFPTERLEMIYSGPHIYISNPLFKTSRRKCVFNGDYDCIDLTNVDEKYFQRCNYIPKCEINEFINRTPKTSWGTLYCDEYRIVNRAMLNLSGERTLISTIISPNTSHIHTIFGLAFRDMKIIPSLAGALSSLPYDYFIKITNKGFASYDVMKNFPVVNNYDIAVRELMLVSLNESYSTLWKKVFNPEINVSWSKSAPRLDNKRFSTLTSEWIWDTPLRTDYERRQALVEIDVLTAMALGMTLEQLKTIYRIQFPVLQQYEADTWYDANGRIVFTTNRSLVGVGFDRKEWEGNIKGAPAGQKFYRTINDDTQPGGPVERTIEYVAPFDKCDREQDYETAWRFFEKKYGE